MEREVLLATYSNPMEAEVARSVLESVGIPAILIRDDAGGAYPFLQTTRGVKLVVALEDEARAREALETDTDDEDSPA
jgi:hypothetical protein